MFYDTPVQVVMGCFSKESKESQVYAVVICDGLSFGGDNAWFLKGGNNLSRGVFL